MAQDPTPVILDCDPGHDDAIALLLALASSEIDLSAGAAPSSITGSAPTAP